MKKSSIVLASTNLHKLHEFEILFKTYSEYLLELTTVDKEKLAAVETADSLSENCRAKVRYVYEQLNEDKPVLADDSGIFVDHLNGAPGVFSARFAANDPIAANCVSLDDANNQKLLKHLKNTENRNAFFKCNLQLLIPKAILTKDFILKFDNLKLHELEVKAEEDKSCFYIEVETSWQGEIAHQVAGVKGFGYDPVFIAKYNNPNAQTVAGLSVDYKAQHSHRGQAVKKLCQYLQQLGV